MRSSASRARKPSVTTRPSVRTVTRSSSPRLSDVTSVYVRALGIVLAVLAVLGFGVTHVGCGDDGTEYFTVVHDAGNDADDASRDGEVEIDPTLGGPCTEDSQCIDAVTLADGGSVPIGCTADRCDKTLNRCRHTPDDTLC